MQIRGADLRRQKKILCTWFGLEFDYKSDEKRTKLSCISETSIPADFGNPKDILGTNTTSKRFELELEGESGHFFNPQYFSYRVRPLGDAVIVASGTCRFKDLDVLHYKFKLKFPSYPEVG